MQTEGDSKRKLSERKDPGASAGRHIEQGFPADTIHYHRRGPATGQPAQTPLHEAPASASIPQFWPGHPHARQARSGPIQGKSGAGPGQSRHSGLPEGRPGTRSNSLHHPFAYLVWPGTQSAAAQQAMSGLTISVSRQAGGLSVRAGVTGQPLPSAQFYPNGARVYVIESSLGDDSTNIDYNLGDDGLVVTDAQGRIRQ